MFRASFKSIENSPPAFRKFVPHLRSIVTKRCFALFVTDSGKLSEPLHKRKSPYYIIYIIYSILDRYWNCVRDLCGQMNRQRCVLNKVQQFTQNKPTHFAFHSRRTAHRTHSPQWRRCLLGTPTQSSAAGRQNINTYSDAWHIFSSNRYWWNSVQMWTEKCDDILTDLGFFVSLSVESHILFSDKLSTFFKKSTKRLSSQCHRNLHAMAAVCVSYGCFSRRNPSGNSHKTGDSPHPQHEHKRW